MTVRQRILVGALTVLLTLAGCARTGPEPAPGGSDVSVAPAPDHFVAATGPEDEPVMRIMSDYAVAVSDPEVLGEISTVVVSGRVVGVERSFVDSAGGIGTVYSVQAETVYKGTDVADVISVALPGGTMPLGEYIAALDELGMYEMKLGAKDLDRDGEPDGGPGGYQDPRLMDPMLPVSENWGVNPAGAKTLAELQPDLWVFYIGGYEDGSYFGTAFDYSLKYLKDGEVRSLDTEMDVPPFPEAELFKK